MFRKIFVTLSICIMMGQSCKSEQKKNMISEEINTNWIFTDVGGMYKGNATVPGTIHTDLLANNLIEDPFYRINEKTQQWIDKKDWEYSTSFNIESKVFEKTHLILRLNDT